MPYGELMRWMAVCLPIGLYYLWHERYRLHWFLKALVTVAATACTVSVWMGALSLFAQPNPIMAHPLSTTPLQQDIYPLVVDADGAYYHLEGCKFIKPGAAPIKLIQAANQKIPADELCNPPRYDGRN